MTITMPTQSKHTKYIASDDYKKQIIHKFLMDLQNDDLWGEGVGLKGDQLTDYKDYGEKTVVEYARRFPDSSVVEVVKTMFREYKGSRVQKIIDVFKEDLNDWYPDIDNEPYIKYVESNAELFENMYPNSGVGEIVVYMFTDYD